MAQTAEAVGFDSIWLGDHLLYDLEIGPRGPWEVWTSLAALAACTERVQLGPLVASAGFHEPTMLAKQAATVDGISGGRLILGLGSGWNEREYRAFGFAYDRRVSRFAEAFTIIRTLLADGEIDYSGEFYQAENCVLHPRPIRPGGPPLMVGSTRPRMLSITLPYVDSWNVWWSDYGNSPAGFAELKSKVDEQALQQGRQAGSVSATCAVFIQLPDGGGRQMGGYGGSPVEPVRGTPEEVAEQLAAFGHAGADHIQLVVDPITRDSVEWFEAMFAALDG